MDAVKIRIYSLSKDASGEGQSTEQNYTGTMAERAGKYYVMYNEDAQSGLEGTKTTLKWDQIVLLSCVVARWTIARNLPRVIRIKVFIGRRIWKYP